MFAQSGAAALSLTNKMTLQTATAKGRKSALDEFLPELDVQRDNREARIDPDEIDFDPIVIDPEHVAAPFGSATTDPSRAQLWPMLAAALVGVGAAILAFSAFARLGHF